MLLKFAEGTELEMFTGAMEGVVTFNGSTRSALNFSFDAAKYSMDTLLGHFKTAAKTATMTTDKVVTNTATGATSTSPTVYPDYQIFVTASQQVENMGFDPATNSEIKKEIIRITMARYTPIELLLKGMGITIPA